MFRLANFDDETKDDENGIYRFISSAVSTTITDCLDEYLIDPESYRIYFGMFFEGGFFEGLSRYITPDVSLGMTGIQNGGLLPSGMPRNGVTGIPDIFFSMFGMYIF